MQHQVLYRSRSTVKVGELNRFHIEYVPKDDEEYDPELDSLWIRVKNTEALPLRAAYLGGPFILYCDVRPGNYDQNINLYSQADQPSYESQLKAGQSFYAQLFLHRIKEKYTWTVDVISQVLFSTNASVQFEFMISKNKDHLHKSVPAVLSSQKIGLTVTKNDTLDIWNSPIPRPDDPVHLVLVTHGLHSNVGADMLYLKEKIDEMAEKTGENLIVRGFHKNACRTEKGIKYQGRRVGDYVLDELIPKNHDNSKGRITRISFIGHSLGGLVQTFAIAHIQSQRPDFFNQIEPVNFITMATPHLGISNENPGYIKFALDIGFAGTTGQDLGLTWRPGAKNHKPLLQVLPTGPTHEALKKFKFRTLYANSVNDGIVPLRTSAILYLDWKGLSKAAKAKRGEGVEKEHKQGKEAGSPAPPSTPKLNSDSNSNSSSSANTREIENKSSDQRPSDSKSQLGEIPEEEHKDEPQTKQNFLKTFTKQSGELVDSITGPFNQLFSFLAPQAGSKKPGKIYKRSQTINDEDNVTDDEGEEDATLPRKTSMLESGVSVLVPPLPSHEFIVDPSTRPSVIFHDRVYDENDLPKRRFKTRSSFFAPISPKSATATATATTASSASSVDSSSTTTHDINTESNLVEKAKVEERIAREWHREMKWRKVLVRLEPDAHNNIIVRRRFANAYGWPVVDHLVEHHFGPRVFKESTEMKNNRMRPIDVIKPANKQVSKQLPFGNIPEDKVVNANNNDSDNDNDSSREIDISQLSIDTSVPDNEARSNSTGSSPINVNTRRPKRSNTAESTIRAWKAHLQPEPDEDEDEGIVHSMGSWIDNLRGFGNLNLNGFVQQQEGQSVQDGEEQEQDNLSKLMEQSANY